ncbi:ras-associated and pleckstrin homology domains-containing protein 1 isoform X3 [Cryptotermes secundus]|nr:ras-associated and pleckstrin homology domains-containing protein 1 isoform X3 [Cryptotermes secundus]XP_023708640.1 ras-associated and pleckstrin homology domains-containing protein 1 isoform X3 [Cryptotermes secundus]
MDCEDSSYNSTSEPELDSDPEDPERLLNEWLGELDSLTVGLDNVSSGALRPLTSDLNTPRIDSYRFSMANLEDSQDVDLDAILGELCALENQYDAALTGGTGGRNNSQHTGSKRTSVPNTGMDRAGQHQSLLQQHRRTHSRSSSEGNQMLKLDPSDTDPLTKSEGGVRTDSPDNDSAFSDNVSMLSSESSASSGGSGGRTDPGGKTNGRNLAPSPTQMDAASRAKAEKIRIALEKMKEASVKKLFIKAFSADGSTKSLLVDEKMTCAYVTRLLADKNHVHMDPKWGIVEHLPDLYMERVYEDHELLVENLMMWTRDSKNKLLFLERPDKTELFSAPENFLLSHSDRSNTDFDDHARAILLEEFFSSTSVGVPEVDGSLFLKADSKKGWKKHHFVLRASGLYYWPKEKAKSSRDLVCLATFDVNQVYYGVGWRKKFKSPTDFCFAIKHPRLQQPKSSKYIKFLCAEDQASLDRWVMGIRLAKHGRQLLDSYRSLVDDLAQEDLDLLAHARSCSVSSIAGGGMGQPAGTPCSHSSSEPDQDQDQLQPAVAVTPTYNHSFHGTVDGLPGPRLRRRDSSRSRASSSSSSGCMSDGGAPSSCCEVAFECDFPTTGTIKRKPSMNPKLPLTSITRQLKEVGETVVEGSSPPDTESRSGTLTRSGTRQSRRRSSNISSEESGSNSSTLKRCQNHHRGSNSGSSSNASTPIRERPSELSPVESPARVPVSDVIQNGIEFTEPESLDYESQDGIEASDSLPPPPPEMFQSTLSLDSLPPPPLPSELPVYTDLGGSSLSLLSLPPPPSPCIDSTTIRKQHNLPPPHQVTKLPTPHSSTSSTPTNALSPSTTPTRTRPLCFSPPSSPRASTTPRVPPKPTPISSRQGSLSRQQSLESGSSSHYAVPPYLAELKAGSPLMARKACVNSVTGSSPKSPISPATPSSPPPPQSCVAPKSPILLTKHRTRTASKKISFNFTPEEIGGESIGATTPSSPTYGSNKKPLPPKRSESTRLSTTPSPKRLSDADSTLTPPPKDFLKDLQRIMRKKWQVAQKCKLDSSTTPHEVLGFRDPPPPVADYRETNVSNWVQEHYGTRDNLYENVYLVGGSPSVQEVTYTSQSQTMPPSVDYYSRNQANSVAMAIANKKRPPPPPPKRSETTQLSTARLH